MADVKEKVVSTEELYNDDENEKKATKKTVAKKSKIKK